MVNVKNQTEKPQKKPKGSCKLLFHNYDFQKMFLCHLSRDVQLLLTLTPNEHTTETYIAKIRPCSFKVSHFFITKQPTLCKYLNQSNITLIIEHNLARDLVTKLFSACYTTKKVIA